MRTLTTTLLIFCGLLSAQSNPSITNGPLNAASYAVPGQVNEGISQGGMFVIFGRDMGPANLVLVDKFPLTNTLGQTSVRVTVNGVNYDAPMIYSFATQVSAILPSSVPTGTGTLTVTYQGRTSLPVPIKVVANAFGIFTRNQAGTGPAIVQNFNSALDTPTNSYIDALHPGQIGVIWGTGLGRTTLNEIAGPVPGDMTNLTVDVFIGGKPATVTYRGRSGCCAGIDQIVFTTPTGVEGCAVSVAVRVNGVVSNLGTVAVTPTAKVCSDATGLTSADLSKITGGAGLTIGNVNIIHTSVTVPSLGISAVTDFANGRFQRFTGAADVLGYIHGTVATTEGTPSVGSCYAAPFTFDGNVLNAVFPDIPQTGSLRAINGGSMLNFTGPNGSAFLDRVDENNGVGTPSYNYTAIIGGGIPGLSATLPPYIVPGNYTVANGSGAVNNTGIGPFTASLTYPATQPTWTNAESITQVDRSKDLTITWTAATGFSVVGIVGSSADTTTGAGMQFLCVAPASAGTFTVPSWVLSTLPASGTSGFLPVGFLQFVTGPPQPSRFAATGLDVGFFQWINTNIRGIAYK